VEEGKGEVEKVNRGGPILPGLIMYFLTFETLLLYLTPRSDNHRRHQPQSTMPVPSQFHLEVQHGKSGGLSHDVCA
jgi:hypothetical protein